MVKAFVCSVLFMVVIEHVGYWLLFKTQSRGDVFLPVKAFRSSLVNTFVLRFRSVLTLGWRAAVNFSLGFFVKLTHVSSKARFSSFFSRCIPFSLATSQGGGAISLEFSHGFLGTCLKWCFSRFLSHMESLYRALAGCKMIMLRAALFFIFWGSVNIYTEYLFNVVEFDHYNITAEGMEIGGPLRLEFAGDHISDPLRRATIYVDGFTVVLDHRILFIENPELRREVYRELASE